MSQQIQQKGIHFRYEEGYAAAAISPGHLVEITSAVRTADPVDTVQVHSTEGGYAFSSFAVADVLQGEEITDSYSAGDVVGIHYCMPGDIVQARLKVGENATKGDLLISAGDGTLIVNGQEASGTTVRKIVGQILETKDLSGSGAVTTLVDILVY